MSIASCFGKHVWAQAKVYDPEGLLSTIPAIATSSDWSVDRHWLRRKKRATKKRRGCLSWARLRCDRLGVELVLLINKALWTSSYVLFTADWRCSFSPSVTG
jgi:predicted acyltransferase